MNRPAVREALKSLEILGAIKIVQGKGAIVLETSVDSIIKPLVEQIFLTRANVLNLLEVREFLEPGCAFAAATRINSEQLQKLSEHVVQMRNAIEGSEFADSDYKFHLLVVEASNNPILIQIYETVASLLKLLQTTTANLPGHEKSIEFHLKIYKAIYEQDAEKAASLMKEHIIDTRKRFINYQIAKDLSQ